VTDDQLDAHQTGGTSPPSESPRLLAAPAAADGLPRYVTPRQLADSLQVDVATIYRWADRDRTMPKTTIGGTVRFELQAIQKWLQVRARRPRGAR
jgi:excisionase family DNA binding protein